MIREGYATILANARTLRPEADILGIYVQPMVSAGQDVIIGAVQDAQFGPLVMFGSGGVEVEGLNDISFGLAPLPIREAEQIIDNTWAGRKLRGYRNLQAVDRQAH
jgi:acetyltransferase